MHSPSFAQASHRLNMRLAIAYALSLLGLMVALVWFGHWQRTQMLNGYAHSVRSNLVNRNLRGAYEALRPALHDGFTSATLLNPRGRVLMSVPRSQNLADRSWRSFSITRTVPVDPRAPEAGVLATVRLSYDVDAALLLFPVAALVLLGLFYVLHRISRRGLELSMAVEEIDRRARRERRVAEQLAHDIRTPLSAMSLTLERMGEISEAERSLLARAARRIGQIADDLMAAPATSSTDVPTFELNEVLRQVFGETKVAYADRPDLKFELDVDLTRPKVCVGSAADVSRVISNLMNNAVEAVGRSGRVTLSLREKNDVMEVVIQDNGRGIASSLMNRLGRERVTFGKARTPGEGGLGLTHAVRVAEACGGSLRLESEDGHGTRAIFRLTSPC